MIYVGIDPGLNGGVAMIGQPGALVTVKTPVIGGKEYDIQGMRRVLEFPTEAFVTIENQISMPGQGLTSTLQTGKGFGIWLGLLAGLKIPHQVVSAQQWQRKMFVGVKASLDTKEKSEVIAKRLFPEHDFRKSERATKADDGLTDAACIAEFGRRMYLSIGTPADIGPQPEFSHVESIGAPGICVKCGRHTGDGLGCIVAG